MAVGACARRMLLVVALRVLLGGRSRAGGVLLIVSLLVLLRLLFVRIGGAGGMFLVVTLLVLLGAGGVYAVPAAVVILLPARAGVLIDVAIVIGVHIAVGGFTTAVLP